MSKSELFILGDPRFLSGGYDGNCLVTCESPVRLLSSAQPVITTQTLMNLCRGKGLDITEYSNDVPALMRKVTQQCIHAGRDSYHRHEYHPDDCHAAPGFNIFCTPSDLPTLGIELETYCKAHSGEDICSQIDFMRKELVSNWFHFEEDGSLDRTRGHELITEVLPPEVYRNLYTWIGLQNCISPWLESWRCSSTGLHVHVGVKQFDDCPNIPVRHGLSKRILAKLAILFVYSEMLGYNLGDKVFLRKNGDYCRFIPTPIFTKLARETRVREMTAEEMFDHLYTEYYGTPHGLSTVLDHIYDDASHPSRWGSWLDTTRDDEPKPNALEPFTGHHTEINVEHKETIEFRRGKGTTNAVSIHRMVEYCSLIVRYVWKAARTPNMIISPETAFDYIINNTTSEALRKVAKSAWSK